MKRILFPTDFSDTAKNAFLYALNMAEILNAEIILLHTFDIPLINSGEIPINYKEIYDTIELQQTTQFQDHIPELIQIATQNNLQHIPMKHVIKSAGLHIAIEDAVKQNDVALVVIGNSGSHAWFENWFGSNASDLITSLPVPILTVPKEAHFSAIKNIAFTNLYREKDFQTLERISIIAKKLNATIKSIYVKISSSDITEDDIQMFQNRASHLNVQFFVIPHDDVRETIEDFLATQQIDLLAILTSIRGFFAELFSSSLTQKLSSEIEVPILSLHEED
ncbi:universal stress protein [Flavobacterium sp. NST-5]|uniref:Universal stress protein n=1 Tax=Flavobacterium ichthyis TaxID=2698827 RepID=A0ABW9Z878_9FLAO|nr:universal stress protein [Flavobacterium ichthyis]NBL65078.1 universal stress protein [Flavobacterium ichthyis]